MIWGRGRGKRDGEPDWCPLASPKPCQINKQVKVNDSLAIKIKLEDKSAYLSSTRLLP